MDNASVPGFATADDRLVDDEHYPDVEDRLTAIIAVQTLEDTGYQVFHHQLLPFPTPR